MSGVGSGPGVVSLGFTAGFGTLGLWVEASALDASA